MFNIQKHALIVMGELGLVLSVDFLQVKSCVAREQFKRDRRAIRKVLELLGTATFQDIALRAGEGLYPSLYLMLEDGEVEIVSHGPNKYKLK